MIELLRQQISPETSLEKKLNVLRESLQLLTLKIIYDKGYFSRLAFVGGTALRVLHDTRRFSEDLNFSVIAKDGYDFSLILRAIENEFRLNGLNIEMKNKASKTVQNSLMKFPGLLKELGISDLAAQKLSIKIEVDSMPPDGWQIVSSLVNKIYILNITHYDLPSLYSTKLHACFFRRYTKGRNFYDFVWYLGKKVKPNYKLLNNAIIQMHGKNPILDEENIGDFLMKKVASVDFNAVKRDVERFLEDKSELALLNRETISNAIKAAFQ